MKKTEAKQRLNEIEVEKTTLLKIINAPEISKEQRFLHLINGCEIKTDMEKYPNSIFFFKNDEYFLEIEKSILWVRYSKIWSVFENEFCMTYQQIQTFIKVEVEEHFKMVGLTPETLKKITLHWVEEHFKMVGLTPCKCKPYHNCWVEEHFKMVGLTPEQKII